MDDISTQIANQLYGMARDRNAENVNIDLNGVPTLVIQRMEDADHVLRLNAGNYRKNMKWFRHMFGLSRVSEDGVAWEARRDLTQPHFNRFDRRRAFGVSAGHARHALNKMIAASAGGASVIDDLTLRQMTANVVMESFFGVSLEDTPIDLAVMTQMIALGSTCAFMPTGKDATLHKDDMARLTRLRREAIGSMQFVRDGGLPETPVLAGICAADRDPSTGITLEHELSTFIIVGSETTAATTGWACHVLATHPELQDGLRAIAQAFWASGKPDWAKLGQLAPLEQFISETLRLYPPTPIVARLAAGPDRIGDQPIEAGQNVVVSLIGLAHDARLREDPWRYDARKGLGGRGAGEKIAFSYGPRICGGKQFAMVELTAVLSYFLAHARFEPTSDEPVRFLWKSLMLREGGQRVRVLPA